MQIPIYKSSCSDDIIIQKKKKGKKERNITSEFLRKIILLGLLVITFFPYFSIVIINYIYITSYTYARIILYCRAFNIIQSKKKRHY